MILTPTTQILARIFAGVTLIFTIAIEAANATTYYVATNGNDSNPGTNSQPLRTITKGVKILSAGDTLYVKAGTYSESIRSSQLSIPNGTSWNNPITIAANPGDTVTIKPLVDNAFVWILDGQSKYLIIKGFIVDGASKALHGFKFEGGTKYVRVINCEVKNAKHSGILVTTPSTSANNINTHHEFINLKVHHNGSSGADHGFYINTSNNLVESSQFYNNKGNGGKFYHASFNGSANNNIARNNKFYNNSVAGIWSCGLILSSGNGNQAYNNVAYGNYAGFCIQARVTNARLFNNIAYENGYYGIYVGYNTTSGSRVENNTVYDNGTYGIFVGDDATSTTVKNNISLANPIDIGLQVAATNSNNFTSDPLFVNAGAKDFHLKSNSPAIDKGTSISGITIDHDGKPRPKGAQFDIGAHEYQGSSGSSPGGSSPGGSSPGGSTATTNSFPPPIASPAPNTTLTSSSITFSGAHTSQDLEHLLRVGTTSGGSNLYNQSLGSGHSATVSGLPSTGKIYVSYWTRNSSGWFVNIVTYTMNVGGSSTSSSPGGSSPGGSTATTNSFPPPIASPAPNTTLTSSSITFSGAHTSQDLEHLLRVGTTSGGSNLYNQSLGSGHSATVSGLPSTGKIYVSYWTRNSSGWFVNIVTYTMNVGGSSTSSSTSSSTVTTSNFPPPVASPSPGSTLTSRTVTFHGSHTGAGLEHLLRIGTTSWGSNLYNQSLGSGHSATVSGLPSTGKIYVSYWTRSTSGWFVNRATYTMNAN